MSKNLMETANLGMCGPLSLPALNLASPAISGANLQLSSMWLGGQAGALETCRPTVGNHIGAHSRAAHSMVLGYRPR